MKNKLSSTNQENNSKPVSKIYLAGFCLILALPLLSIPPIFDPPDWGKTIVFRVIISILALFFGYQILSKKISVDFHFNWRKSTSWVIMLFTTLFLCYGLSTAFSVDIHNSLWGTPYRAGGFFNIAALFIFTFLLFTIVKEDDWLKLFRAAVFTGIPVTIIALFQRLGVLPSIFKSTVLEVSSTIGGPNFLSHYLLILLLLTALLFLKDKNRKIIYSVSGLLFLLGIVISRSQASYLGLAMAIIFLAIVLPVKSRLFVIIRFCFLGILLIILTATVYFRIYPQKLFSDDLILKPLIRWHIDQSRLSAWKVAIEAIKSRPLTGFGVDNFSIAFNKYYRPDLPEIEKDPLNKSSWWDRAHNIFLDIAVSEGIVTVLVYVIVLLFLIRNLWIWQIDNSVTAGGKNSEFDGYFLIAVFTAYHINLLFSFESFSSSLVMSLLTAYSLRLLAPSILVIKTVHESQFAIKSTHKIGYITLAVFTFFFICQYAVKPLIANGQINSAYNMAASGNCLKAIDLTKIAMGNNTIIDGYLYLKAAEVYRCAIATSGDEANYKDNVNQTIDVLKKSATITPNYPRTWLYLSEFTTLLIDKENDPAAKNNLLDTVNGYLEKARELSPRRQETVIDWAKANIAANNYPEALKRAVECRDLNANLGECYWLMGISQIYLGAENSQIANNLQLAKSNGYDAELTPSLTILVNAYISTNNFPALVEPLEKLIILNPENGDYHGQLATVYKELGDYKKAKDEALKLLELEPEAKDEVEEFIKSLGG